MILKNSYIIGGNFGENPKESKIITILQENIEKYFNNTSLLNGGTIEDLNNINLNGSDLIIWAPNIINEEPKHYPIKKIGSVLICTKVIHDGLTDYDSVSRIFKMNGNAVISIRKNDNLFSFKLIDALGNVWCDTKDIKELSKYIFKFYKFTKNSIRIKTEMLSNFPIEVSDEQKYFIDLNKLVADKAESMGDRYFGNCSTRCSLMFPSIKLSNNNILVSKRNTDKSRLTIDDLILVSNHKDVIYYNGLYKPSVDTPIHLKLYEIFPDIKYMIHGHYYIENAPFTEHYHLCGDLNEYKSISNVIVRTGKFNNGVINLKNHGFLIYSNDVSYIGSLILNSNFIKRQIGLENI